MGLGPCERDRVVRVAVAVDEPGRGLGIWKYGIAFVHGRPTLIRSPYGRGLE